MSSAIMVVEEKGNGYYAKTRSICSRISPCLSYLFSILLLTESCYCIFLRSKIRDKEMPLRGVLE